MGQRRFRPTSNAFTLIELLVVIAIIALLVGLILPVLGASRKSAAATQCLSNQRQLLLATNLYLHDFAHVFPQPFEDGDIPSVEARRTAMWFNGLDPYLGQLAVDYGGGDRNYESFKQDPVWHQLADGEGNRTIKMNGSFGHLMPGGTVRFVNEGQLKTPGKTVLFCDGRADDIRADIIASQFYVTEGAVGLRHGDGANVAFADGHAVHTKQAIRTDTAAPSWYAEPDPRQTLVWNVP